LVHGLLRETSSSCRTEVSWRAQCSLARARVYQMWASSRLRSGILKSVRPPTTLVKLGFRL
jgi:hypothetical protein